MSEVMNFPNVLANAKINYTRVKALKEVCVYLGAFLWECRSEKMNLELLSFHCLT